jgi:pectate lyase
MRSLKTAVGLSLVCVVGGFAFGAANASAATLYECVKVAAGTGKWEDKNCEKTGGGKEFETTATGVNVFTKLTSNSTTEFSIEGTITKTAFKIQCKRQESTGETVNHEVGGQRVEGSSILFTFLECTMPSGPKGCGVNGTITSETLTVESFTETATNFLRFIPPASGIFLTFTLSGCSEPANNGKYEVLGKGVGRSSNSTEVFDAESNKKGTLTLKQGGGFAVSILGTTLLTTTAKGLRTMIE